MLTWFPHNLLHMLHQWAPPRRSLWNAVQSVGWFPQLSYKCIPYYWGNYWGSLEKWKSQIRLYSLPSTLWKETDHKRENSKYYITFIRHSVIGTSLIYANALEFQEPFWDVQRMSSFQNKIFAISKAKTITTSKPEWCSKSCYI